MDKTAKTTLKLFDCELYHGGVKTHSIPLRGITMKELVLLRALHGQDAILDKEIKDSKPAEGEFDERELLFTLARKYGNTADPMSGKKLIERVLSVPLVGFEAWIEDQIQLEQMERDERQEAFQKEMRLTRARMAAGAVEALREQPA